MTREKICVVFDLDDTLYLERDFVRSGFEAADKWCAENLGVTGMREHAEAVFAEGERKHIFDMALTRVGINCDAQILSQIVGVYREHVPGIALLPEEYIAPDLASGRAPRHRSRR